MEKEIPKELSQKLDELISKSSWEELIAVMAIVGQWDERLKEMKDSGYLIDSTDSTNLSSPDSG